MSALVLAQEAGDDAAKKAPKEHMVITGKNRDQVRLTPEQQGVVDKLTRLPGTANIGVLHLATMGLAIGRATRKFLFRSPTGSRLHLSAHNLPSRQNRASPGGARSKARASVPS